MNEPSRIDPDEEKYHPSKHRTSFGEVMFDSAVYGGVGYLATAAISLVVSHYAINKKGSWMNLKGNQIEKGFENFYNNFLENPEQIKRWADLSNNIFFLGAGGWALVVPMKWMEDNKAAIVKSVDRLFGTGPQTEKQHRAEDDYFASIPQQDYVSLLGGRTISYSATIAFAIPMMTKFKTNMQLNEFLTKNFSKEFKHFTNPPKLIDLTSKEIILAGTSATLTYGFSKGIAWAKHALKNTPLEELADKADDQPSGDSYLFGNGSTITPSTSVDKESINHESVSHDVSTSAERA